MSGFFGKSTVGRTLLPSHLPKDFTQKLPIRKSLPGKDLKVDREGVAPSTRGFSVYVPFFRLRHLFQ
jgi:hypothetical protein